MSQHKIRLETLFSQCDTSGTGLINSDDFQDLCAGFGIEEVDQRLQRSPLLCV